MTKPHARERISRLLGAFMLVAFLCSSAVAGVTNGSFEDPQIAPNTFVTRPDNVPGWTFQGNSGLANGSTSWSSGAQEGTQYAFLRCLNNPGIVSQFMTDLVPGQEYRVVFWMRRRSQQNYSLISVYIDDAIEVLSQVNPLSTQWTAFGTQYFTATSTTHKVSFVAQQTGQDLTTVLDNVKVELGPAIPGLPINGSFETPALEAGNWNYGLTALDIGWLFDGRTGIANGNSSWGRGGQDGAQYAFVQMDGTFTQTIGLLSPGRTYHARWYMMRRNGGVGADTGNPIQVYFDNTVVFPFTLYDSPTWLEFASEPYLATNATALMKFKGGPNVGDRTELIDNVRIFSNEEVTPDAYQLARGFLVSGDLSSLSLADRQYLIARRGITFNVNDPPVQLVVTGHSPVAAPKYMNLRVVSSASLTGLSQKVEAFNYQTQVWDAFATTDLATADGTVSIIKLAEAFKYCDPQTQEVKVRLIVKPSAPIFTTQWTVKFDQVHWSVSNP